jgi:hypothetical protein
LGDDDQKRPQRKHKRVPAREVVALTERDGTAVSYTVVNLSIGGMLVTGTPQLGKGEAFEFELKLKGSKAVAVRAQVVHSRFEGMGIAFDSLASEDLQAMEKLIAAVEAQGFTPPPLPAVRIRTGEELPPAAARPDDSMFVTHDPRPPRSGAPDEREEYLRTLVKNRDEVIRRARVSLGAIAVEADSLRSAAARLKSRLEAANGQLSLTEVALTTARVELEKQRDAQLTERATAQDLLEQEQRRTLEAIGAVSAVEAKLRRHEMESKRAVEEAEGAKREAQALIADAGSVRRAREELLVANRKAMESQAALKRERDAKAVADKSLAEATSEVEQLKAEVSKLKAKLVAAENALERAATRKATVPPQARPGAK